MLNFIKYLTTIIFLLTCFNNFSFPQELSEGELEVKTRAYEYFENKNFHKALPLFSQLLSLYPKNPEYNYCYGVCLIQLNKETEKAAKYLEFASTNDVNSDVYFFLAKAYHLNYRFDDAIKYYNMFKEKGKKSQVKEYKPDRQIKMCNNGKDLIRYISELTVLENKQIKDRDFYRSYEIADFGGIILNNPFEFKTKIDRREKDNSILFLSIERNVIYLSSYGKNKKNGKDIYCVTRLEDSKWSKPENLGKVINTTYDEAFPYIHPDGKTLYFSSKGHNSMGGYDIFRSTYDSTAQSWTEPVNLDFPTNSPYDDILFISDAKEDIAYFASNRETQQEKISVYKIQIDKNPVEKELHNLEEIALKSKLALSPLAEELAERIQSSKVSKPQVTSNFYNYNTDFSVQPNKERTYTFAEVEHTDDIDADGISETSKIAPDKKQIAFQKENIDSSTVVEADAKAENISSYDSLQFFPVDSNQRIIADFYNYNKNLSIKLYKKRTNTFAEVEHTDDFNANDISETSKIAPDEKQIAVQKENIDSSADLSAEFFPPKADPPQAEEKAEAEAKVDVSDVANAKSDKSQEFKKELSFDKELDDESRFVAINKNVDELKSEQTADDTKDEYLEMEKNKSTLSSDRVTLSNATALSNDRDRDRATVPVYSGSTITEDNKEIPGSNSVKITNITELNGLLYTIQIGAYKNPVESSDLLNLYPIYKEQTNVGFTRYTTGNYNDYAKALSEKGRIVRLGIKDAFVVAYYNGKRISISEARRIRIK